jgi:hypothetical protein
MNKTFYPMLCALLNTSNRWIETTVNVKNRDLTIKQIETENGFELNRSSELDPFNPALVMASAYIFFVYPKEHEKNLPKIEYSNFTVIQGKSYDLERRLRNSIAHGNYEFLEGNIIKFTDHNNGKNLIEFSIPLVDFANILNSRLKAFGPVENSA